MIDISKLTKEQLNRISQKHPEINIIRVTPKAFARTPHQAMLEFNIRGNIAYLKPNYQTGLFYGFYYSNLGAIHRIQPSMSFSTAIDRLVSKCVVYQKIQRADNEN